LTTPAAASPAGGSAGLPDYLTRPPSGFYRTVNPATKLTVAALEVVAAFLVPGWLGPLAVLAVVLATAVAARRVRPLALIAAATLPLVISIVVVNLFLLPGANDAIFRAGPIAPTWSGLSFGLQTTARFLAFSLAIGLVYLTTPIDDLLADLARRGVGRRPVFVVGAAVETVPRTIERAREIVDAQRARGLDTQGRFFRRAAGVVPLAAPLILGALAEVEERTLALEARAFTAPGRTTLLRVPADTLVDRLVRWAAILAILALVALRVTGRPG
jgi:energy-coupling factor transport system permease protein